MCENVMSSTQNSPNYKWCAIPLCENTSIKTPSKLFIHVSNKQNVWEQWFQLARRDPASISANSSIFLAVLRMCCRTSRPRFLCSKEGQASAYTKESFKDGVKTITLSHSKTRNALSVGMMNELLSKVTDQKNDPALRVIVLSHEGPAFSSGHDLRELRQLADKGCAAEVFSLAAQLMTALIASPVPILVRVDGVAAAAGCQLVAQCDIAFCTSRSTFSTPGAARGVFCSAPGVALVRRIGTSSALRMLLTGRPLSANDAQRLGLVTTVCETEEELNKEVEAVCMDIKSNSRQLVEHGRQFFFQQLSMDIHTAYDQAAAAMSKSSCTVDGQEGLNSFVEKRKPKWSA